MRTWIFQGNPDEFDLDSYFATAPTEIPWLVTRYSNDIMIGDRVYIWRTQGKQKAVAGVIAEGEVIAPVALRSESPDAVPFWRTGAAEATETRPRILLRLVRVATLREVIRRFEFRRQIFNNPFLELGNLKERRTVAAIIVAVPEYWSADDGREMNQMMQRIEEAKARRDSKARVDADPIQHLNKIFAHRAAETAGPVNLLE
jgi:hypothetical protein